MNYFVKNMRDYANFQGRARREEYWMFKLMSVGIFIGTMFLMALNSYLFFIPIIYLFAIIIPSISVTVRRLHDIGLSGWWYLIGLIPYLGGLALFIMSCIDSTHGPNQYGENPKGVGIEGPVVKMY